MLSFETMHNSVHLLQSTVETEVLKYQIVPDKPLQLRHRTMSMLKFKTRSIYCLLLLLMSLFFQSCFLQHGIYPLLLSV